VKERQNEIATVIEFYNFTGVCNLSLTPAQLEMISREKLIALIGRIMHEIKPHVIYLPYRGDIHSDHGVVLDAVAACTKWFRYPTIRRVLCYETLSETDFGINPETLKFTPNTYVNITNFIDQKIKIAEIYKS